MRSRGLDGKRDAVASLRLGQAPAQVLPALDRLAVERDHDVAGAYSGRSRGRARRRIGQQRTLAGNACHVRSREEQDREQQIGERTRGDDGDALPHALAIESTIEIRARDVAFALVGHLHVAAERDRRQRPLGLVAAEAAHR
jgi:hypothetical protein